MSCISHPNGFPFLFVLFVFLGPGNAHSIQLTSTVPDELVHSYWFHHCFGILYAYRDVNATLHRCMESVLNRAATSALLGPSSLYHTLKRYRLTITRFAIPRVVVRVGVKVGHLTVTQKILGMADPNQSNRSSNILRRLHCLKER